VYTIITPYLGKKFTEISAKRKGSEEPYSYYFLAGSAFFSSFLASVFAGAASFLASTFAGAAAGAAGALGASAAKAADAKSVAIKVAINFILKFPLYKHRQHYLRIYITLLLK
jgi:hypothetical protein